MPLLPSFGNRKITAAIVAVARSQTNVSAFDLHRATQIAARLDAALVDERTAEVTYALCALLLKGMGIGGPRELADLLLRNDRGN